MNSFFLVSCLLAVASAQYHGGYNPAPAPQQGPTGGYQGPLHVPVLNAHGVPQEPAAVIAARNAHLANFGGAQPQGEPQYQEPQPQYQAQPQQYQPQPQQYQPQPQYQANQYQAPQQRQVPHAKIGPDGFPQDAPDVAAARAAHFALFAEANARNAPQAQQYAPQPQYNPPQQYSQPQQYNQPQQYSQPQYNPQQYAPAQQQVPAGLPQETPEVAAARAAHFAAHAALPPAAPEQQHY